MAYNVAQKLIASHLVSGEMVPGTEIGLQIDQTLAQDATSTKDVILEMLRRHGVKGGVNLIVEYYDVTEEIDLASILREPEPA